MNYFLHNFPILIPSNKMEIAGNIRTKLIYLVLNRLTNKSKIYPKQREKE